MSGCIVKPWGSSWPRAINAFKKAFKLAIWVPEEAAYISFRWVAMFEPGCGYFNYNLIVFVIVTTNLEMQELPQLWTKVLTNPVLLLKVLLLFLDLFLSNLILWRSNNDIILPRRITSNVWVSCIGSESSMIAVRSLSALAKSRGACVGGTWTDFSQINVFICALYVGGTALMLKAAFGSDIKKWGVRVSPATGIASDVGSFEHHGMILSV